MSFFAASDLAATVSSNLIESGIKGAAILAIISVIAMILRRSSAAVRHMIWVLGAVGSLAIPLLAAVLPEWRLLPAASNQTTSRTNSAVAIVDRSQHEITVLDYRMNNIDLETLRNTSMTATPAIPVSNRFSDRLILAVWAVGVLAALTTYLLGKASLWKLRTKSRLVVDQATNCVALELAARIGIRRQFLLLECADRTIPMTWGSFPWSPAYILLPKDRGMWKDSALRAVLLHELAHVKRCDCLIQQLVQLSRAIYWFNPLVWFAARRIRIEMERACDDVVLADTAKPSDYAEHLTEIAAGYDRLARLHPVAVAAVRKGRLERRLREILDPLRNRRPLTAAKRGTAIGLTLALVMAVSAFQTHAQAQEKHQIPAARLEKSTPLIPRKEYKPSGSSAPRPSPPTYTAARISRAPGAPIYIPVSQEIVGDVKFGDQRLGSVFEALSGALNVKFVVNWDAMEGQSVDVNTLAADIDVGGLTVAHALTRILDSVVNEDGISPLSWATKDQDILISTKDDIEQHQVIRVYNVRDLIFWHGAEWFADLIMDGLDPDTWAPNGGRGSIRELNGRLIITATERRHLKILEFIERLRSPEATLIVDAHFTRVATDKLPTLLERGEIDPDVLTASEAAKEKHFTIPWIMLDEPKAAFLSEFFKRKAKEHQGAKLRLIVPVGMWASISVTEPEPKSDRVYAAMKVMVESLELDGRVGLFVFPHSPGDPLNRKPADSEKSPDRPKSPRKVVIASLYPGQKILAVLPPDFVRTTGIENEENDSLLLGVFSVSSYEDAPPLAPGLQKRAIELRSDREKNMQTAEPRFNQYADAIRRNIESTPQNLEEARRLLNEATEDLKKAFDGWASQNAKCRVLWSKLEALQAAVDAAAAVERQ
jgi:beta-lactamase regulating signal transducer with metallopeptidase domain